MYDVIRSEPGVYTVVFHRPDNTYNTLSDHPTMKEALDQIHYLNGGTNVKLHQIYRLMEVIKDVLKRLD